MTDTYIADPRKLIAAKLPEMDPVLRRRVLDRVMRQVGEIINETKARERAWRHQQPGQDHVSRGISKSELEIERRLLAIMKQELKTRHGVKSWRQKNILALAAEYRRLRTGRGISGVTSG